MVFVTSLRSIKEQKKLIIKILTQFRSLCHNSMVMDNNSVWLLFKETCYQLKCIGFKILILSTVLPTFNHLVTHCEI